MIVQLHIFDCDWGKALRPSGARGMETLMTLDAVGKDWRADVSRGLPVLRV